MLVATLKTKILSTAVGSGGLYEQPVDIPRRIINADPDKRGLIMRVISEHLAVAMQHTEVPFLKWQIHFAPETQRALNVPETVSMENADDISRLTL